MYDPAATLRAAPRRLEPLPGVDPAAGFHLALGRVRKLLGDYQPGMSAEPARLRPALEAAQADPALEGERLFVLGWLGWQEGDWAGAEGWLARAEERSSTPLSPRGEGPSSPLSP